MSQIRVLNLVTNDESRFFKQQVKYLRERNVRSETIAVPGDRWWRNGESGSRTILDYLRMYPTTLRRSFGSFDLIHANYGLTAPAAVAQPNLPVVISLWGTDLMGRFGPVSKLCARMGDAVIVMSEEMAAELDRPCHVIPHGVNFERFAPIPRQDARDAVGWDHDRYHVLFPYPTNRSVKNHPRARRIVDEVNDRLSRPVELQVVWGKPHDRVPVYMNAADALLLTSRREGSPNSVKEALACNVPIVSTDVGDVKKRIRDVRPSFVGRTDRELVDGLVTVLERGERSNGREQIEDLRVEATTRRIRSVYEAVIAGST